MNTDTTEPTLDPSETAPPEIDADTCNAWGKILFEEGKFDEAARAYSAATALAPSRYDSWANLGLSVLRDGRPEEAMLLERQALRLNPGSVEALNNLGIAMHAVNALVEAENHFRGVLRCDRHHPGATLNLGVVRHSLGHLAEAESLYRRALALGCDAPRVYNNLALVLAEQGEFTAAEDACREALTLNPGYAEAEVNLGLIALMRGDMSEGWTFYESRWRIPPLSRQKQLPGETHLKTALSIEGKKIFLLAEQGFGDTLQFCRYAPHLAAAGADVTIAVPSPLVRVLGSLHNITVIGETHPIPDHDFHCHLMSLPLIFGTRVETIPSHVPYLSAETEAVWRWSARMAEADSSGGVRVGLVWAGSQRLDQPLAAAIDKRRSMLVADMAALGAVPDCVFVSLQVGARSQDVREAPFPLLDFTSELTDFGETAALIQALDLVICVDTAVAHLAGAMGKPVWLLNRFDACWRWLPGEGDFGREDTPWYPAMRLFRQAQRGEWAPVMERVTEALRAFRRAG